MTDSNDAVLQVNFNEIVDGSEYDYLYIDLSTDLDFKKEYTGDLNERLMYYFSRNTKLDMYRVAVLWGDEQGEYAEESQCSMVLGNGKLFISIGHNSSWRLGRHASVRLKFTDNVTNNTHITVNRVELFGR